MAWKPGGGNKKWSGNKKWGGKKWGGNKKGGGKKWGGKKTQRNYVKRDESGGEVGKFTGNISRKEKTRKYGFILCPNLQRKGHGDVFVNWVELKNFKDGTTVTFTAYKTATGQVQAKGLKSKKDETGGTLGAHKGKILRHGSKFGYISCDDLKGRGYDDVFVNWDELKYYKKGQTVNFTAFLDGLGRLQAKDLKSGLK